MERLAVGLPAAEEAGDKLIEFEAGDAHAMLSWLQHDVKARTAPLFCGGVRKGQLRRLGRRDQSYWMIVPQEDRDPSASTPD